ncbi:MAG: hypothetical protein JOZ64_18910, partial [Solirubrobacterales bacterium]|nr:hypothetical protein [Solirubrobacterales bacterium]
GVDDEAAGAEVLAVFAAEAAEMTALAAVENAGGDGAVVGCAVAGPDAASVVVDRLGMAGGIAGEAVDGLVVGTLGAETVRAWAVAVGATAIEAVEAVAAVGCDVVDVDAVDLGEAAAVGELGAGVAVTVDAGVVFTAPPAAGSVVGVDVVGVLAGGVDADVVEDVGLAADTDVADAEPSAE